MNSLAPAAGPTSWRVALPAFPFILLFGFMFIVPMMLVAAYAVQADFTQWQRLLDSAMTWEVMGRTFLIASQCTVICAALSYLYVGLLLRTTGIVRYLLIGAVVVPFLSSILVRTYAWMVVLGKDGPVQMLVRLVFRTDLADSFLFSRGSVILGMVHVLLPFFILPLYAVMLSIDSDCVRAARSLGANRVDTYVRVITRLSLPGAAAGAAIVFVQALGFFITPALLGGFGDLMMAQLIDQKMSPAGLGVPNFSAGAILACFLLVFVLAVIGIFRLFYPIEALFVRSQYFSQVQGTPPAHDAPRTPWVSNLGHFAHRAWLAASEILDRFPWRGLCWVFGIATALFFVLPLVIVVPIAFTADSYIQFPPSAFSWRWFEAVVSSEMWIRSIVNSGVLMLLVTVFVLVIGTPTAFFLVRAPVTERFKGFLMLLLVLPAVIPAIVLAIGIYLWFLKVKLVHSLPALAVAHTLFALPYFTLVLLAALRTFDPTLERAARSLGANAWETICLVTTPLLLPALSAGLFFAALTSFDELLVARAVTDVDTLTLPIQLWSGAQDQLSPALAAVSVLSIGVTLLGAIVFGGVGARIRSGQSLSRRTRVIS